MFDKRIILLTLLLIPSSSYSMEQNLEEVAFLLGCWENKKEQEINKESWKRVSNIKFEGKGVTLDSGKVSFWEKLEIFLENGKIVYQPYPLGKKSVPFSYQNQSHAKSLKKVAFINMDHDFPQQIIYSMDVKTSPEVLSIELKGVDENSKAMGSSYSLKRETCTNQFSVEK